VRRRFLEITQAELARTIGLTFQQIQKYEKGANRVAAATLYRIGLVLNVPPAYFFEGLPDVPVEGLDDAEQRAAMAFLDSEGAHELMAAYPVLSPALQRRIAHLAHDLAEAAERAEANSAANREFIERFRSSLPDAPNPEFG
jgi:transcriptional regulator with XRE-family HTH domain